MKQIVHDLPKTSAPAQRALESAGIASLEQLTKVTEAELAQLHGMGSNALGKLREALKANGLSFRDPKKTPGGKMDKTIRSKMDVIFTDYGEAQFKAYDYLMKESEKPVNWAYEVWDELVDGLTHTDNHVSAICGQLLGNLGKSDPKGRMFKDFDKLLNVTKDEKFVTARHTLQNIWKVGLGGKKAQQLVVKGLEQRFIECVAEKNGTLIRYDIQVALRNLYDVTTSSEIKEKALELIELERDQKYKKKYATVWKKA
jgi:hypothetical protein